ncbi:Protein phosphatase 2C-like protein 2 [Verticillium dahliae VDG2]|nr:Protein phosphatase 2C-like protein 2 [Verticillium dahliae VDG2]
MASQIAAYEEDRKAYQEQLDVVVAGLSDDPDNAELKNLQAELQEMISLIDESLAELKPKQAPQPAAPVKAPTPTPPEPEKCHNGIVTSASASIYPEQQARLDAEKLGGDAVAKPPKAKKIKANKELEKGKSKWQEFSSKSKFGKTQKKDSMFRTPEGVHGRVGFTGSGQAMRKDPTRSRHVYQQNEEVE